MADVMNSVSTAALPGLRLPPPPPPAGYIVPSAPLPFPYVPLTPVEAHKTKSAIKWRWTHLLAFWVVSFGLPAGFARAMAPSSQRLSEFLDAALFFQIVGYVLGALLITHTIRSEQQGDWSTLGITWSRAAPREILRGAGFGLLLLGCFLPISFLLAGGEFEVQGLVRLLVGSTSGFGLVLAAVVVVFGAPIIEEIYFRGILYEKLARRNTMLAIIVTTFVFTLAHGALFIPAILILGFGLAWQRRTKGLWYTMGAHAAWNLVVTVLAAFLILGGWNFSPADGSYAIRLPRSWERVENLPAPLAVGLQMDLAMSTNNGSGVVFMRIPAVDGSARATLERLIVEADKSGTDALPRTPIESHPHLFDDGSESVRMSFGVVEGGVQVASHLFVMARPGSSEALVINLVCQRVICQDDGGHLDKVMHELDFAPSN